MSKFKVGDRVTVVSNTSNHGLEVGYQYTINLVDSDQNDPLPYRMNHYGEQWWAAERDLEPVQSSIPTIKSNGGATSYYELPEHATELRHLISYKGMSKARGDIFKACYRLGEKEGTDTLYDLNKIKFFIEDLIEMNERGEHL